MEDKNFDTDSLEWSDIVNIIQDDNNTAGDLLNQLAKESDELEKEDRKLKEKLNNIKFRKSQISNGLNNILKHIKKPNGVTVQRDGYLVRATNGSVKIDNNVL